MEQPSLPPKSPSSKSVYDLEFDVLTHCVNHLSLSDLSNFARTCKFFKSIAYSDSVWRPLFRNQWPKLESSSISRASSARNAYLDRHAAVQQFKLEEDVIEKYWSFQGSGDSRCLLLDKDEIFLTSGSMIVKINYLSDGSHPLVYMRDHNAKITCMRLFPASKTSLFRNEAGHEDNFLVTSSCDHSIRLWWKGHCCRNFKGHNVPVTTLSDKLLGEGSSSTDNLIASGGEDGTVRLWSLRSNSKRGQRALRATLKGHGRAIKTLSVSGYKTSLLVSISRDAKIKVWDTAASSSACSSRCVGDASVNGPPLGIKCFESLCYVATGTAITAIDLRTMEKVFSAAAACQSQFYSFDVLPSKSLVCTGGRDKAMLWDVRRSGTNLSQ
ncbi:hypothetical protein Syun_023749 [Stephania yunnanensis]|uniref:F-box domain-containing protein n=1 Tax=Stephania yunnanensis TaxID=152371 RepID=A0AAP0FNU8_9MAGN